MEKLNLVPILKNCPNGMELNCTMFDDVRFDYIDEEDSNYPIKCFIETKNGNNVVWFTKYGEYCTGNNSKCVIFPKGKTSWEGFQIPFKAGDIVYNTVNHTIGILMDDKYRTLYKICDIHKGTFRYDEERPIFIEQQDYRFATPEEQQIFFDAIKDNGYKWNAETKSMEKLIEPKFRAGDKVRSKLKPDYIYTIHSLTWDDDNQLAYNFLPNNDKHLRLVKLNTQDNYEIVERYPHPNSEKIQKTTFTITKIENPKADWKRVLKAARKTVGKKDIDKEPSDEFKRQMLLAEHSPIRLLEYDIDIDDVAQWITVHYVRHHVGIEKFIHTQRTDRNPLLKGLNRDELPQGMLTNMMLSCNAQSMINISRKRLCTKASEETREVWKAVLAYLKELDPILVEKCVPECLYRGFCPEKKCCGFVNTTEYLDKLNTYRRKHNDAPKQD